MSKMIRVNEELSSKIDDISKVLKVSKHQVVQDAVDLLNRELFLKKTNSQYKYFLKNKKHFDDLQEEIAEWDATLLDGLEDE